MLFGKNSQVNKILSKSKFAKQTGLVTQTKKEFEEVLDRIILANIIRKDTVNIEAGETVKEILVLELLLKKQFFSDKIIKEIDAVIPKSILYCLRFEDKAQLAISFKESGKDTFKVVKIYRSAWMKYDDLSLEIIGLNLDTVFNNFIEQIADGKIALSSDTTIKEAVEKSVNREKLEKQIARLENKLRNEKQFNKQLELKNQIKNLRLLNNN